MPIELVSITETEPIALVSPENGNGIVSRKEPPAARPSVLENHCVAVSLSGMSKLVPVSCAPVAAAKVTSALVRSRGVEVATTSTLKPVAVTFVIRTEPAEIAGAIRGTVIGADGSGFDSSRA